MTEEKRKTTSSDELAFYKIMRDSYKQRYKFRSWMFSRLLRHLLSKIREESTIYYIMEEMKENRN